MSDTENLALKKPTWQEHPWPDPRRDFGSENAVDGLYYDRRARSGQCTINDDGYYTAEWRVDLGNVLKISHINIFYRTFNQSILFVLACTCNKGSHQPANESLINCFIFLIDTCN